MNNNKQYKHLGRLKHECLKSIKTLNEQIKDKTDRLKMIEKWMISIELEELVE